MSKRKYTIITPIKLVHIFLCPSKEIWKIMIDFHNYTEYDILNEHMTTILVTPIKHVLISLHSFSTAFLKLLKRPTMYAAKRETYHFSNFYLYNHNQSSWVLSLEKNDPSSIRDGFLKKSSCSFGFFPNEGGGRALPNFLGTLAFNTSGTSCPN